MSYQFVDKLVVSLHGWGKSIAVGEMACRDHMCDRIRCLQ